MAKTRTAAKDGPIFSGALDMNAPDTAEKFRRAALIYTNEAKRSKESAVNALRREGFLTKTGKVAKIYLDRP
ncbi:hypothetical protein [Methylobacterium trifolii]|uniref:Uncharacterized protein n=1 Tax=Methylobacterium trifolii TaxID=1003092 RepID=A0ABQ4U0C9_9HYPH|nr:hypothetical protein [Methylobacterium trifolii]GJE60901.1 hypothetical protein MPOCJGCO_3020 [Methylobacterium trifolii]